MSTNTMTWRQMAAPIIAAVIAEHKAAGERAVRRALRDAYPWGERENHPYKVWLDECRKQMARAFPRPFSPVEMPLFADVEGKC